MRIEEMIDRRPNFILVVLHGLGDYLGAYGRPGVHTPWLDSLSYQGMLFENYLVTAPVLPPTTEPFTSQVVPELNAAGYLTHAIAPPPSGRHLPPFLERTPIDGTAQQASAVARDFLIAHAPDIETPFFLAMHVTELLRRESDGRFRDSYDPELAQYVEPPPVIPATAPMKDDYVEFLCALQSVDFYLARLMDELEERGVEDDTLVMVVGDGGPEFPRMRGTLYDTGMKSALLCRWSSILPGSYRSSVLLTPGHLACTILDLIGARAPAGLTGESFRPLLEGDPYGGPEAIRTAWPGKHNDCPGHALRTHRYKYILNARPGTPGPISPLLIKRHGQDLAALHFARPSPPAELYDLLDDPWEQVNLVDVSEYAEIRDELDARVRAAMPAR